MNNSITSKGEILVDTSLAPTIGVCIIGRLITMQGEDMGMIKTSLVVEVVQITHLNYMITTSLGGMYVVHTMYAD